jgi:hypothetical protein
MSGNSISALSGENKNTDKSMFNIFLTDRVYLLLIQSPLCKVLGLYATAWGKRELRGIIVQSGSDRKYNQTSY